MIMSSNANGISEPAGKKLKTDKAARKQKFLDVFPIISKELVGYVQGEGMPEDAVSWYERVSTDSHSL
jgi:farnesyl diphosphate synthase